MVRLRDIESQEDVATLRALLLEYAESLGFELDFQQFDSELENLPGEYAPPAGCALLAEDEGAVVGCGAIRPLADGACEMKRLYVRPRHRGAGAGRALAEELIRRARRAGYERVRLDTIRTMTAANGLYRALGFTEIESYRHNPIEGATYFELALGDGPTPHGGDS